MYTLPRVVLIAGLKRAKNRLSLLSDTIINSYTSQDAYPAHKSRKIFVSSTYLKSLSN